MHALKMKNIMGFLPEIACVAGAMIFTIIYISTEQRIYHGDYLHYYATYKRVAQFFFEDWPSGPSDLLFEISNDTYNPTAIIPLLPIHWLFGDDRIYYITGIILLYLTPVTIIATRLARDDAESTQHKNLALFFAAFLFPVFWMPTLRGMIDIAGLVPLGFAALLLQKTDYLTKANWKEAASFGLLLWCAFLLRRWYAFSIIALVMTSLIFIVIRTLWKRLPLTKTFIGVVFPYGLAGVTALLAAINVQSNLIKRIVSTSYVDVYEAFQRDAMVQIQIYYDHLGLTIIGFVLAGVIVAAFQRRAQPCFYTCVAILTAVLFAGVQAPDRHHILPVAFFLFPAYFSGLSYVAQQLKSPFVTSALISVIPCLNFLSTFVPNAWGATQPLHLLFPRVDYSPLRLQQYDEYKRLSSDLRELGPNVTISVFASSMTLTSDMLQTIEPALGHSIKRVPDIDRRDGFSWSTIATDYALIAIPTPLHQRPESQRIITYPAQSIRAGTGIGAAFRDTGQIYQLDQGVEAYIYKRVRPVTPKEISDLANRFYEVYPEWKKKTADFGLGLATAIIDRGDTGGWVAAFDPFGILLRPGETTPTSVTFQMNEWFRPSQFTVYPADTNLRICRHGKNSSFEFSGDGLAATSHVVTSEQPFTGQVPPGVHLKITVPPQPNPNCTSALIIFGFNEDGK